MRVLNPSQSQSTQYIDRGQTSRTAKSPPTQQLLCSRKFPSLLIAQEAFLILHRRNLDNKPVSKQQSWDLTRCIWLQCPCSLQRRSAQRLEEGSNLCTLGESCHGDMTHGEVKRTHSTSLTLLRELPINTQEPCPCGAWWSLSPTSLDNEKTCLKKTCDWCRPNQYKMREESHESLPRMAFLFPSGPNVSLRLSPSA